jgi:hypothetical protein
MQPFVIIFVMMMMPGRPPVNGRRTSSHLASLIANVLQHRLHLVHQFITTTASPGSTTVLHRRLTCNIAPSPSSPP